MRDRLIELKTKFVADFACGDCEPENGKCMDCLCGKEADYLLENGVIALPCKVGDEVWAIKNYRGKKHIQRGFVSQIYFCKDMALMVVVKHIARGFWGEKIFPTKEEAERALEGGEQ